MNDLVVVSLEPWDDVWRRNQHVVAGLLSADPRSRVLFVEPPADPLHDLRRGRMPRGGRRPRLSRDFDASRLWTFRPVKWLPRRWRQASDDRLAHAVVRAARRVGMRDPVLWLNDPGAAILSEISGWATLYDITDDWLAADRPPAQLRRLEEGERRLLESADAVVACSPEIVRRKSAQLPADRHPIALIRNAVDSAAYRRPASRPADLPTGPTAVYLGTVHADRFDVEACLSAAASLRGTGTVVLVGPMLLSSEQAGRLRRAGVVALGARGHEAVIGYLQHADVLIVPHLVDEFTDSLDPIKLYEYQAVGRPVVSTPVAGFRDAGDPRVIIADAQQFGAHVRAAIESAKPFPVGADGATADWSERVAQFAGLLSRLRAQRG